MGKECDYFDESTGKCKHTEIYNEVCYCDEDGDIISGTTLNMGKCPYYKKIPAQDGFA